jgi:hypothetical protein
MRRTGHAADMGEMRKAYKVWSVNLKGRGKRRWEDNIKRVLKQTRCEDVERINVSQDGVRRRSFVITVFIPSGS